MRVALGSDHAGYDLKAVLASTLTGWGQNVVDLGSTDGAKSVDYADFGADVGRSVADAKCDLGVAVCGSGGGISMAANKVPGVRAALVHDATSARLARERDHATFSASALASLANWWLSTPSMRGGTPRPKRATSVVLRNCTRSMSAR